jgi:hypothetical protein
VILIVTLILCNEIAGKTASKYFNFCLHYQTFELCNDISSNFDVLLTVHLSLFVLVINQLDAQNVCFAISLFHASTCFEHHVFIIRRSKFYYTTYGINHTCRWPSHARDISSVTLHCGVAWKKNLKSTGRRLLHEDAQSNRKICLDEETNKF